MRSFWIMLSTICIGCSSTQHVGSTSLSVQDKLPSQACFRGELPVIVGNSFDGKLANAINIQDELETLSWKNVYRYLSPRENQWGTRDMCVALGRLGKFVQQTDQNFSIGIGDISLKNGKKFALHIAHQTGLEADIFYFRKKTTASVIAGSVYKIVFQKN